MMLEKVGFSTKLRQNSNKNPTRNALFQTFGIREQHADRAVSPALRSVGSWWSLDRPVRPGAAATELGRVYRAPQLRAEGPYRSTVRH